MHTTKHSLRIITAVLAVLICTLYIALGSSAPKAQALVHNQRFANCKKLNGIDVSKWQTTIDWKKVKADGIDFVIIKLGGSDRETGVHYTDPNYYTNLAGAKAAGLKVGVYFYSSAITKAEAVSEGKYALKILGNTKLDLPVYFDQECTEGRVDPSAITTWSMTQFALGFMDTVSAGGYTAGYYSYLSWLTYEVDPSYFETKYPVWVANVVNETKYKGIYHMWQYSFTGKVDGIPTAVDRDVLYVNEPPAKVTGVKATIDVNKAVISWSKTKNTDGYNIYKVVDGKTSLAGTVSADTLSFTVDATPVAAKYYVRAYTDGVALVEGDASASVTVKANVPYDLSSKTKLDSITLSWAELKGASGYIVYYDKGSGKYEWAGRTNSTSLKLKGLKSNTGYDLAVKAYFNADGSAEYTEGSSTLSGISKTHHTGTQNVMVTDITLKKNGPTSQTLTWTAPKGKANGFRVYIYNKQTGKYTRAAQVTGTEAVITGLTPGTEYTYMVRSYYTTADTTVLSQYSDNVSFNTQATKVTDFRTAARDETSITLSWKKGSQGKAAAYRVYSYDTAAKKYTRLTQTKDTSYTVTGLTAGKPYTFLVRSLYKAENGETVLSEYSDLHSTGTMAKKATGVKVSLNSKKYQTISWTIPKGQTVDGSRVYSYDPKTKKYKRLCDVKTNSFKVTGLKANTEYYYLVRTYYKTGSGTILSTYSSLLHCTTCANAPADLTSSSVKTTSVKLGWGKVNGITGYIVYKVDADGKYTQVKTTASNSYTVSGLSAGKKYTFAVRAYKKIEGVRYLGFSSKKISVTTKKK